MLNNFSTTTISQVIFLQTFIINKFLFIKRELFFFYIETKCYDYPFKSFFFFILIVQRERERIYKKFLLFLAFKSKSEVKDIINIYCYILKPNQPPIKISIYKIRNKNNSFNMNLLKTNVALFYI